jgi:hypothetical protein
MKISGILGSIDFDSIIKAAKQINGAVDQAIATAQSLTVPSNSVLQQQVDDMRASINKALTTPSWLGLIPDTCITNALSTNQEAISSLMATIGSTQSTNAIRLALASPSHTFLYDTQTPALLAITESIRNTSASIANIVSGIGDNLRNFALAGLAPMPAITQGTLYAISLAEYVTVITSAVIQKSKLKHGQLALVQAYKKLNLFTFLITNLQGIQEIHRSEILNMLEVLKAILLDVTRALTLGISSCYALIKAIVSFLATITLGRCVLALWAISPPLVSRPQVQPNAPSF